MLMWSIIWASSMIDVGGTLAKCDGRSVADERLPAGLHLPLDHLLLDLGDRLRRIEMLRAGVGAVHDGMAAIKPERVLEIVEPLAGRLVAAVGDPTLRLQQRRRAEETVAVPPVART